MPFGFPSESAFGFAGILTRPPAGESGSGMITVGVACAKFRMARIEDSSLASAFSEVYNFTTVLAFLSSALLVLAFFSSGSNLGRV